eukprot:COSAG01_NODE_68678_length_263_cov_0.939024_1_plen_61_part_10
MWLCGQVWRIFRALSAGADEHDESFEAELREAIAKVGHCCCPALPSTVSVLSAVCNCPAVF